MPSTGPMRLKAASRTRSPVGRVSRLLGAKMRAPLREPEMIRNAIGLLEQRPLGVDQLGRPPTGLRDQLAISRQPRELEIGEPGLARAEQLSLPTQLEVDLRELEAVGGLHEGFEAPLRLVGQLLLGTRDQEAVGLLPPAPHATP